jgi:hypothetical protein
VSGAASGCPSSRGSRSGPIDYKLFHHESTDISQSGWILKTAAFRLIRLCPGLFSNVTDSFQRILSLRIEAVRPRLTLPVSGGLSQGNGSDVMVRALAGWKAGHSLCAAGFMFANILKRTAGPLGRSNLLVLWFRCKLWYNNSRQFPEWAGA